MKYRLLAPGPTPIPDRVLSSMNRAIYHHRTPAFEGIMSECQKGLKWLLDTKLDVLTLACSGTGAFEAALQNFFSPNDKILNIGGGKFAERWGKMANIFGLRVVDVPVEWGRVATLENIRRNLEENPDFKGVICVASETSTGVRQPYEEVAKLVDGMKDCLFILDAITALGVWDICPERDKIDVLIGGSQKGLMLPPGLGLIAVSEKAWRRQETAKIPRFYFDLARERKAQAKQQSAFTPPVSLLVGLRESLAMMQEEGRDVIFSRHARLARATRQAMKALGLTLFAQVPSDSVTSVMNPDSVRQNAVYEGLRDRANITIAGGQEHLKGKIFRLAHMGYFDDLDIFTVLCALEVVLKQEGYEAFSSGAGVAAAAEVLKQGFCSKVHQEIV